MERQSSVSAAILLVALVLAGPAAGLAGAEEAPAAPAVRKLELSPVSMNGVGGLLGGTYDVFENRDKGEGLVLSLKVHVLKATGSDPLPDPIFMFAGGPGQAATDYIPMLANSWMREQRDIVLIDQRGTGDSNRLDCELPGGPDDPQGYLEPIFIEKPFRDCAKKLADQADLRFYTTPIAMDDVDDTRGCVRVLQSLVIERREQLPHCW